MSHPFRRLDERTLVHGQISVADITTARAAGVTGIINNRPDGEEPGQITGAEIEAAAVAAGMTYLAAPSYGMPDDSVVDAVSHAFLARGPNEHILMFCKSGMRSTIAWALVRAQTGANADTIRTAAAHAGYDLTRLPL